MPLHRANYLASDIGYHYTDSTRISVGAIRSVYDSTEKELEIEKGVLVKLHYNYKIEGTDITPYITAGMGVAIIEPIKQPDTDDDIFFAYQISSGINLPLSSRTSIFAGYKLQKLQKLSHGVELGIRFNL